MLFDLTSYMDETGHSDDPKFHFAGMAGFVAEAKLWQKFGETWQAILDLFELKEPFHMKDFAHSAGQFKEWKNKESKRRMLLWGLLQVIVKSGATPIGAIVSLEDYRGLSVCQQRAFKDPYYLAFQTCTRGASTEAMDLDPPEKVAMVYSYNQEFGATRPQETYSVDQAGHAEQLWHQMKDHTDFGKWMGSYASSTPAELVQLQAADLFAYELAKEFQNRLVRPNDSMRYGLREILRLVSPFFMGIRLFDRKEMLRIIKESEWPCQENTDEVADIEVQMQSAQQRMWKWMEDRAGITRPDIDELNLEGL